MVRHNPSDARRQRRAASARSAASQFRPRAGGSGLMTCTSEVVHPHLFVIFHMTHPTSARHQSPSWKRSYLYGTGVSSPPASPTDATQPYSGCVSAAERALKRTKKPTQRGRVGFTVSTIPQTVQAGWLQPHARTFGSTLARAQLSASTCHLRSRVLVRQHDC